MVVPVWRCGYVSIYGRVKTKIPAGNGGDFLISTVRRINNRW